MQIPFLDLKAQFRQIEGQVVQMAIEAMENGAFIGGPHVTGFEQEFAAFCQTSHAVGVGSGTDALRFALMAAGIGAKDTVITVPNTFIATTEAISQVGAAPVFVDVDSKTFTMDPQKLEDYFNKCSTTGLRPLTPDPCPSDPREPEPDSRPKAIIPVHLYGQTADMDSILEIAGRYDIPVIEDACQAHGATYKGKKAGSMGAAGCFSFYPGKNLGAFGEAGAVVTQNRSIADRIQMIKDHGQKEKYIHAIEGYNGRLDAIQAGVLRIKLKHLDNWNQARRNHAARYRQHLAGLTSITMPEEAGYGIGVYHLFVIFTRKRDDLQQFLKHKGVATGLHYPVPLHLQQAYAHLDYKVGDFPVAEKSAKQLLSLPMFPELTPGQIEYVCDSIKEFAEGN